VTSCFTVPCRSTPLVLRWLTRTRISEATEPIPAASPSTEACRPPAPLSAPPTCHVLVAAGSGWLSRRTRAHHRDLTPAAPRARSWGSRGGFKLGQGARRTSVICRPRGNLDATCCKDRGTTHLHCCAATWLSCRSQRVGCFTSNADDG